MADFFLLLFNTDDFPARWYCGDWSVGHGWLHIGSDAAIWGAYTAIPLSIAYFAKRKGDIPFPGIAWLFVAFIMARGLTHLVEAGIFWWPAYRLSGVMKFSTAVASSLTVFALIRVLPAATDLPGLGHLSLQLHGEINRRVEVEDQLRLNWGKPAPTRRRADKDARKGYIVSSSSALLANFQHAPQLVFVRI